MNLIITDLHIMCRILSDKEEYHLYKEYKLITCDTFGVKLYSDIVKLKYRVNNFWYKLWR